MTETQTKRWYGVSTGDGNNGVSHLFPDYYVLTDDPWQLATRAATAVVKEEWRDDLEYDGEAEYNIQAVLYDDQDDDYDPEADYSEWESGPASFLLDVFPLADDDLTNGEPTHGYRVGITGDGRAPMYGSIEDALGEEG